MTRPATEAVHPYPLLFQPLLLEKVWGGDRLARFGKPVAPGARIGESWELADLASTSASGAGGTAAHSVIRNGPLAGRTIRDAVSAWGHNLLGRAPLAAQGGVGEFPLLVKFLDARENLSVQVHPSPAYAAAHPGAHLKTECWYILHAEPGAMIYKGCKPGVTRAQWQQALADGVGNRTVDLMAAVPAVVGECHNLPSGTVHALGAGVVVAEVQTPSDTTFRVYDWGRTGRQLHVEQALQCIDYAPAPAASPAATSSSHAAIAHAHRRLVTTAYFTLDESRPTPGQRTTLLPGHASTPSTPTAAVLMVVGGAGRLVSTTHAFADLPVTAGDTVLVPAAIAPGAELIADSAITALHALLPAGA
jgi:mannose-6-phosphate isomerase